MSLETWKLASWAEISIVQSEVQEAICPLVVTTKHFLPLQERNPLSRKWPAQEPIGHYFRELFDLVSRLNICRVNINYLKQEKNGTFS